MSLSSSRVAVPALKPSQLQFQLTAVLQQLAKDYPDELRWLLRDKYGWQPTAGAGMAFPTGAGPVAAELLADLRQLQAGVPVAYLIGWVEFLGCRIELHRRPLIPRPETEYWVERCLRTVPSELVQSDKQDEMGKPSPVAVLDLCCGSGCIGIAMLQHWPDCRVTFVDLDPAAVAQTRHNLALNHLAAERWQLQQGDLFSGLTARFGLILANPPYVDPFGSFSDSLRHEPSLALFAQSNGMAVIERIIFTAQKHLLAGGQLWLEFAADQAERVRKLAALAGWQVRVYPDQFGHDRYAVLTSAEPLIGE